VKLKALAEGLRFRSGYAPVAGAEHCPVCWARKKLSVTLRTEPHHNAVGVFAVVCDGCGFYAVL
jgi:C4-type Zn-finger protein